MKKIMFIVLVMMFVVAFAGVLTATQQDGKRPERPGGNQQVPVAPGQGTARGQEGQRQIGPGGGDFEFMLDKDDPRLEQLRAMREEFRAIIQNKPVDKSKLRSVYERMRSLRQKMADDAFEKFLQRVDTLEDRREQREERKERREERKENRQNRPKKQ